MTDLREIIDGCKRNKGKYQDMLYARYSKMLYGTCLRYTRNSFDAEDVLQEGFVKIFKNIGMYSQDKPFEGWIRKIMINTAITHYRKHLKHAYHDDVTESHDLSADLGPDQHCDYTKEELMAAINKLPSGYKMVFNMYVIEGYKHKEIADALSIDINTSKSQLSRAKKHLQRELAEMSKVNL
ncbi:MAG: RNA polymerase sigma factor [Flavobacteriales bacterium]|nr:RNA polymerase sigma factor [Flavobacteriales bacterium]MDG1781322.1 RNA polymerase sigma factor [Flavobacteriales bacterium]MDG2245919.1 RNA polymerase sigma factor [Flavobacteriales bacterium]